MFNLARPNRDFYTYGRSFISYAEGTGIAVTDTEYSQTRFNSGTWISRIDQGMPSWANGTGTLITNAGHVIFDNEINGGALREVVIANRGSNNVYIGFNSNNPSVASGFPLASGESIQYSDAFITEVWAIMASTGTTILSAQGQFVYNDRNLRK